MRFLICQNLHTQVIPVPARPAGIEANETLPPAADEPAKGATFRGLPTNDKTVVPVGQADWGQLKCRSGKGQHREAITFKADASERNRLPTSSAVEMRDFTTVRRQLEVRFSDN